MWVWRHRYEELGAREDVEYVLHLREPRRRGRRHAAPSPRPDLRLPVPAARAGAGARRRRAPRGLRAVRAAARASWTTGGGWCTRTRRSSCTCPTPRAGPMKRMWSCASTARACSTASRASCDALADGLQALVRGYDALFDRPFPYVMAVHQAPTGACAAATRRTGGRAAWTPARRVLPAAAHRREAQVPRRLRAGRGHVHLRHAARGVRRQAARGDRPCRREQRLRRVRARAREPDRRAHRLQRRARAAVRDRRRASRWTRADDSTAAALTAPSA